ncbi:unnamed protein product [Citrullus colocynthis]|uniref:Uncharacterized protein n=1 Tax=Citrullus colocynthis TaxID=252529 RepID=A0ABP0XKT1_9ROSI
METKPNEIDVCLLKNMDLALKGRPLSQTSKSSYFCTLPSEQRNYWSCHNMLLLHVRFPDFCPDPKPLAMIELQNLSEEFSLSSETQTGQRELMKADQNL